MPPTRHIHFDARAIAFSSNTVCTHVPAERVSLQYGTRFRATLLEHAGVGSCQTRFVSLERLYEQALDVLARGEDLLTLLPPLCGVSFLCTDGSYRPSTPDNSLLYLLQQLQLELESQGRSFTFSVDLFSGPEAAPLESACQHFMQMSGIAEPVFEASLRETEQEMPVRGFQGTILRWDTKVLQQNARLLQDQVECLLDRYPPGPEGVLLWGRQQFSLTLEEVRRQIAMAFQEGMHEANWAQVRLDARAAKDSDRDKEEGLTNIKVSNTSQSLKQQEELGLRGGGSRRGKKMTPLGCKPTDLVLLSCHAASSVDELIGRKPHAMGLVKYLEVDDDGGHALVLTMHAPRGSAISRMLGLEGQDAALDEMGGQQQDWFITPLGNMATPSRIWDALQKAMHAASSRQEKDEVQAFRDDELEVLMGIDKATLSSVSRVLLKVLPANPIDFPLPEPEAIRRSNPGLEDRLDAAARYCRDRSLNDSQVHSIEHAVAAAHGRGGVDCSVQLIQGPPGTGKTSAIVALMSVLGGCGKNALLCAPTNVAIREVALRLIDMLKDQTDNASSQFGGSCFMKNGRRLALGDVVLLASEDSVPEDSDVQQVWSSARARRLLDVIRQQGLRNRGADLRLLLGSAKDLYERTTEEPSVAALAPEPVDISAGSSAEAIPALLEQMRQQQQGQQQRQQGQQQQRQQQQQQQLEDGAEVEASKPTLRQWFIQSLRACAQDLIEDAEVIQADLPSSLLLPGASKRVKGILKSLGQLMAQCEKCTDAQLNVALDALSAELSTEPITPAGLSDKSRAVFELGKPLLQQGAFSSLYIPFLDTYHLAEDDKALRDLEQIVLATAPLVFSTVSSAGRTVMLQSRSSAFERSFNDDGLKRAAKRGFDICIVDEAGQLIEAELAIVAQGFPLMPAMVLVGDHQQLPATVMSSLARKMKYGRSLLERLYANNIDMRMLDVQHRMVPEISSYPAAAYYGGLLADGPHVGSPSRPGLALLSESQPFRELGHYAIVNLDRGREERLPFSTSWVNYAEIEAVVALVNEVKAANTKQHSSGLSIGIVTPYNDQAEMIAERLGVPLAKASANKRVAGRDYEMQSWRPLQVEVRSVDGFQGREMDVIIFTTVRNNERGEIGFLGDKRRLNVGITRARLALWVVGHIATLEASGKVSDPKQDADAPPKEQIWADLIQDANMRGRVFQAEQVTAVRKGLKIVADECKRKGDLKNPAMNMFEKLPWKVVTGDAFNTRLRVLLGQEERSQVLLKILQLGQGYRPRNTYGSELVSDEYKGVVHVTPMFNNKLFIIWSVSIDKQLRSQYLKIQSLSRQDGLLDAVRMAQNAVRTHGLTYVEMCKETRRLPGEKAILPVSWPDHIQISWTAVPASANTTTNTTTTTTTTSRATSCAKPAKENGVPDAHANGDTLSSPDPVEEHASQPQSELIQKYYNIDSFAASLLIKADKSEDLDLPFDMSPEESEAIMHEGTMFIQGRSGTGKTTVLINRLLMRQNCNTHLLIQKQREEQQLQDLDAGGTGQLGQGSQLSLPQDPQAQGKQLRQLLVTLSPMLCVTMKDKIYRSLQQRIQVMLGAGQQQGHQLQGQQEQSEEHKDDELMDDEVVEAKLGELPRVLASVPDAMCPLVLPLENLLRMLDASFPEPFRPFQLLDAAAGNVPASAGHDPEGDEDDGEDDTDDDLYEEEEEAEEEGGEEGEGGGPVTGKQRKAAKKRARVKWVPWTYGGTGVGREVKFELFDEVYWSSFDAKARKIAGSSSLVFTEIVSTLKGSTAAMKSKHATNGKTWLPPAEYLSLSSGRGESLKTDQREAILKLFSQYEAKKTERGDWDLMDIVWHIHRRAGSLSGGSLGPFPAAAKFHEIYIDECQDLPQATISLLRFISTETPQKNARGFVFAGDSAQTITRGVNFRFKNLRDQYSADFQGYASQDEHSRQHRKGEITPSMFNLTRNFRTTTQVVRLASSVIRLLLHWFENSLDKLPEEQAEQAGPKPIFIEGTIDPLHVLLTGSKSPDPPQANGSTEASSTQPSSSKKVARSGKQGGAQSYADEEKRQDEQHLAQAAALSSEGVNFGAEQVVIVRDDAEKKELKSNLERYGSAAKGLLVLTVHECKGLEFQNVLIHRFFSRSPQKWRLIYEYMDCKSLLSEQQRTAAEFKYPKFNPQEHVLMCSELKQLYVLITRTKHCVVFYEDDHDSVRPVLDLWHMENVVQHLPLEEVMPYFRSHSSPEDWHRMAKTLYDNKKYEDAMACFERAGDETNAQRAEAQMCRTEARRLKDKRLKGWRDQSKRATQMFLILGLKEHAANEMVFQGEYRQAANMFMKIENYRKAAENFLRTRPVPWKEVAIAKECMGDIQGALNACLKAILPLNPSSSAQESAGSPAAATKAMADLGLCLIQKRLEDEQPAHPRLDPEEAGRLKTTFLRKVVQKISAHGTQDSALDALVVHYVRQFSTLEEQRTFLDRNEMWGVLCMLEQEAENYGGAAPLMELLGDVRGAADCYFRAGNRVHALRLLLRLLRIELMWGSDPQGHKGTGWPFVRLNVQEVESLINQVNEQAAALSQPGQQQTAADQGKLGLLALEAQILQAGRAWCSHHQRSSKNRTKNASGNAPTLSTFTALNASLDKAILTAGLASDVVSASSEQRVYANYLRLQLLRMSWEEVVRECREVVEETEKLNSSLLSQQGIPLVPQQQREQRQKQKAQHQQMADTAVALLQMFDKLRSVLEDCAKVARVLASKGTSSSLDQKSKRMLAMCLLYMAAALNQQNPSQAHLDCKAPVWLPVTTQRMGRDGSLITLSAFGHAASKYWTDRTRDVYRALLELAKKAITPLQPSLTSLRHLLDQQTLASAPTSSNYSNAREALLSSNPSSDATAEGGSEGALTSLGPATRVEACCSLLLAQQASFKHLQSYQAVGNTEHQKLEKQSEEMVSSLFSVVMTPFMAQILQPLSSLVMQCERKEVAKAMRDFADALLTTETPLPAQLKPFSVPKPNMHTGRIQPPLLHPTLSYEALGKLMLLKDVLPYDFVDAQMLDFPETHFQHASPFQLGIMSMRDMQAILVSMTTTQGAQVSDGKNLRIASFAAFHGLRFTSRAVRPARMIFTSSMPGLQTYRATLMNPFTFITLLERNATACMAMAGDLRNLVLPASYAVVHASLDGPSKLLTALLKKGSVPWQGQTMHQEALIEAGQVMADMCRKGWLEQWISATLPLAAQDPKDLETLMKTFRTRALVLWMVIWVNARKDLLVRSREGVSLEDTTVSLLASLKGAPMPTRLQVYISRAACMQPGVLQASQPVQELYSILSSLNDELILLKRSGREATPPWAGNLRTFIVAQRKPLQGQAHARPARAPAALFGSALRAAQGAQFMGEVEFSLDALLGRVKVPAATAPSGANSAAAGRAGLPGQQPTQPHAEQQQQQQQQQQQGKSSSATAAAEREAAEEVAPPVSGGGAGDDEGGGSAELVAAQDKATQELLAKRPGVAAALHAWRKQWQRRRDQQLTPLQQLQWDAWQGFFARDHDLTICARLASRGTPPLRKGMLHKDQERVKAAVAYMLAFVDKLCPLKAWAEATLPTLYKAKEIINRTSKHGAALVRFISLVKARHQALPGVQADGLHQSAGAAGSGAHGAAANGGTNTNGGAYGAGANGGAADAEVDGDGPADAGMDEDAEFDAAEAVKDELLEAVIDALKVLQISVPQAEQGQEYDARLDLAEMEKCVMRPLSKCQKRCTIQPGLLPALLDLVESETT